MLSILADALLVATRFEAPSAQMNHDRILAVVRPTKRSWAQIVGFKR